MQEVVDRINVVTGELVAFVAEGTKSANMKARKASNELSKLMLAFRKASSVWDKENTTKRAPKAETPAA